MVREESGKRVAIIGGGPSGIVSARYLLAQGFQPTVFEQSGDIGGQWNASSQWSGVWPGMRTNTSRVTTQFSDLLHPEQTAMFPHSQEVQAYLRRYANQFNVIRDLRLNTRVDLVEPDGLGYRVHSQVATAENGAAQVPGATERFDYVVVASGRYNQPCIPAVPGLASFSGRAGVHHTFRYKRPDRFRDLRVLVAGCAISALEIASDLAMVGAARVVTCYRRQRYVLPKIYGGVPVDQLLFTRWGVCAGQVLPPQTALAGLQETVLKMGGAPHQFGAMAAHADVTQAGISLCQHFLPFVAEARIGVKPWIERIEGERVTFADGTAEDFDAILFGTGFDLHLPFLSASINRMLDGDGYSMDLASFTFHPDLGRLVFVGLFDQVGPYFPVLELQARWIAYTWAGVVAPPSEVQLRADIAANRPAREQRSKQFMHRMALGFSRKIGAEPEVTASPSLTRALMFGPLASIGFRIHGPDALPDAAEIFLREAARFDCVLGPELSPEQVMQMSALAPSKRQPS